MIAHQITEVGTTILQTAARAFRVVIATSCLFAAFVMFWVLRLAFAIWWPLGAFVLVALILCLYGTYAWGNLRRPLRPPPYA